MKRFGTVGQASEAASRYGRVSRKAHAGVRHLPLTPELFAEAMASAAGRRQPARVADGRRRAFGELVDPVRVEEGGLRWAVLRAQRGWERQVAADLADIGFAAYCPLRTDVVWIKARYGRKPRRQVRQAPVFAPYLFVGAPPGRVVAAHLHARIDDVLAGPEGPIEMPRAAIRWLNDRELDGLWDVRRTAAPRRLRPGDQVRVTSGPFVEFVGELREVGDKDLACVVELAIFGRLTPVRLGACDLDRVCV